ncbi:MAG: DMT family transporter, partial [Clostridiales bacterium]|nr:DMT family transporter [Clostridiales bacterium]
TGVKASVLAATIVFFSLLFACFIFRTEKFSAGKFIGVLIGFCGVIVVNLGGQGWGFNLGDGFILIAAAFGALSSVLMKIFGKDRDPVLLSGWQFFLGGLVLVVLGLAMGGRIPQWSTKGFFILIWLAFVSAAAYSLWGLLLKYNPVSRVAIFNFLDPICGFILSALLLKEEFSALFCILALALVSGGIVISHVLGARSERKNAETVPKDTGGEAESGGTDETDGEHT